MSTFEQTLKLAGLQPRDMRDDGKWRRCPTDDHPKKKNGAYRLEPGGRRGFFRNWADGMGVQAWSDDTEYTPTPGDMKRQAEHRARERAEKIEAVRNARALWSDGQSYRPHPYLTGKGLSAEGCHHLRTWNGSVWVDRGEQITDTWLLVPLYWRDKLVNVQRISSAGVKRQIKAAPQKACSLILGRPSWAVTVICEGLATGLAIYQCMRQARVVVAFFADNLVPVVGELRPTGSVVVVADNDWRTAQRRPDLGNPGILKATDAANLIGAGVVWPEGIEGSDIADMLREYGPTAAKRIERLILGKARYIVKETV